MDFGAAARRAASDIVKRRKGNPDPDGVIASQVVNQIAQNAAPQIASFLERATPPPQASPRAQVASQTQGPPPWANLGQSARAGLSDYDIEYMRETLGIPAPYDPNDPFNQPAMPQLGGPGEGPRYQMGRAELGVPVRMPDIRMPPPASVFRENVMNRNFPEAMLDTKSFPGIYEDGSMAMPGLRQDPRLWPHTSSPTGMPNTSETGAPPIPPSYPAGGPGAPFAPPQQIDPAMIDILRYLGLI